MKGRRSRQTIILIILLIAVTGLTVGFASLTTNIAIKAGLEVDPTTGELILKLSSSNTELLTNDISPIIVGDGVTGTSAKINNNAALGPTINNMNIVFNDKSNTQSVTYKFYIKNDGSIDAYLTDILFLDNSGGKSFKTCTPKSGGTILEAKEFCDSLSITATVAGDTVNAANNTGLVGHLIEQGEYEEVNIVVTYNEKYSITEPVNVELGKIEFVYSTINNTEEYVEAEAAPNTCFEYELDDTNMTATITNYYASSEDCPLSVVIPEEVYSITYTDFNFDTDACINYMKENGLNDTSATSQCTTIKTMIDENPDSSDVQSILSSLIELNIVEVTAIEGTTPYTVTTIGKNAFYEDGLTSVTIPNSVTRIEYGAFYKNKLTSLTIPDSVTSIGTEAFQHNDITSLNIPNSVTSIGGYAFSENELTSLTIPDSITVINSYTFAYNNLTSLIIPDTVTSIGDYAFYYNNLTSVVIGEGITTICIGAFSNNNLTSVTINKAHSDVTMGTKVFGWASGYSNSNIAWNG